MKKFIKRHLLTILALSIFLTHISPTIQSDSLSEPKICTINNSNTSYIPMEDDDDTFES
jgi:hypothetical protein